MSKFTIKKAPVAGKVNFVCSTPVIESTSVGMMTASIDKASFLCSASQNIGRFPPLQKSSTGSSCIDQPGSLCK